MAAESTAMIPPEITKQIIPLKGKLCTLQRVGSDRSLYVGFEDVCFSKHGIPHGTCEIGTYRSAWRIICGGVVLLGKDDAVDDIAELNERFQSLKLGHFNSLYQLSDLDVQITFESGISIQILSTFSDDDEVFHAFLKDNVAITLSQKDGWRIGPSNEPWGGGKG